MRTATLTLITLVACGFATNAQRFSILPQVGFENSKTNISYNDLSSFSPVGVKFSPQGSLRLNYASKQGHGFFLGVASSRSTIVFSFADPETGMNNFATTTGNMQLRLEGGYQFNSRPIYFNKSNSSTAKKPEAATTEKKQCGSYAARSGCHKNYSSSYSRCSDKNKTKSAAKNSGSWVRIQPSIGMGYIPFVKSDVISKTQNGQTTYEYRAGNWNTALIAGTGFEFGRNKTKLFTVSINYFKGLGNLNTQTLSTVSGTKSVTTTLKSEVSGWNLRIGIPFTLGGPRPATKPKTEKKTEQIRKTSCGQYRVIYRCGN